VAAPLEVPHSDTTPPAAGEFDDYEELTPELVEDEAIRGDFVLRWSVVLMAALFGATCIAESATLVHVASGRYLWSHGVWPPANDYLSHSAVDRRWDNLGWGFDLLSATLVGIAGYGGLTALKALVAGATFWRVAHIAREDLRTWWHAWCAALALVVCQPHLTALQTLWTLPGIALTLAWLYEPRVRLGGRATSPTVLIPLFVVWSNLDPRMWLGWLALLLAWGGASWSRDTGTDDAGTPRSSRSTGELARGLGLAVLAGLANPFGWRVLLAPFQMYQRDYAAYRDYLAGGSHGGTVLQYFPITDPGFWNWREPVSYAVVVLFASVVVVLWLHRRGAKAADWLLALGFAAVGCAALREMPVAALVWAVVAGVAGQEWHRAHCRQDYTVEARELLFSRGGRAATVLAFAALAFFGATGRLTESFPSVLGFGLEPQLAAGVESHKAALAKCPDDHPFNTRAVQGDILIAVGGKPFLDSRLPLYHGQGRDNLVRLHGMVRDSLRPQDAANGGAADSTWKTVFDKYGVRSVMPRLAGATGLTAPDYAQLLELLGRDEQWALTHLGPVAAVFVLKGTGDAAVDKLISENKFEPEMLAYRSVPSGPPQPPRETWATPPGFYDRYVWKRYRPVPDEVLEALHLVRLASDPGLPRSWSRFRHALVLLAVRKLHAGLSRDPNLGAGWDSLGTAYRLLMNWEGSVAPPNLGPPPAGLRYYQAVGAFGQALVANPDGEVALANLLQLHQFAGRQELALDTAERVEALLRGKGARSEAERQALREQRAEMLALRVRLRKQVDAAREDLKQFAAEHPEPLEQARRAMGLGLYRSALRLLEDNRAAWQTDVSMRLGYAVLLMEAGRVAEASDELRLLEIPARQSGLGNWREPSVIPLTLQGDHVRAIAILREGRDEAVRGMVGGLLATLPPKGGGERGRLWPLDALSTAFGALGAGYDLDLDGRVLLGVVLLEAGQCAEAAEMFKEVAYGNGNMESRGVSNFLLRMTTGVNSEEVPLLFEPEP
jgi:tetratricopeptide (TPR) repeat protein